MNKVKFALWTLVGIPGWLLGALGLSFPFLLVWPFWHVSFLDGAGLTLVTSPLIVGAVLIPVAAALGAMKERPSLKYAGRTVLAFSWPPMWIFSNEEDGIQGSANGFWPVTHGFDLWKQIFAWSALRNSVGNARWLPFFGLTLTKPAAIIIVTGGSLKEGPYVARQGLRCELRFCWNQKQPDWHKRRYMWMGWRLVGAQPGETGIGFAFQPLVRL